MEFPVIQKCTKLRQMHVNCICFAISLHLGQDVLNPQTPKMSIQPNFHIFHIFDIFILEAIVVE